MCWQIIYARSQPKLRPVFGMKLSEVVLQPCRRAGGGLSRAALCPSVRAVGAGS